jgi:T5SS/PEP-CTERM-associated repeat protein
MVTTGDATIGVADPDFDPVNPFLSVSQPTGRVTVTGLGSRWTTQSSLIIGDDLTDTDEQGYGVLEIGDQAIVQVGNYTTQTPFEEDELIINTNGRVELAGGTLRVQTGTSVTNQIPILNNGVIKGDGMIDGMLDILPSGELRNAAGVANLREELIVTGLVENFGTIESLGGEMEFLSEVVNNFEIVARDAVMRFPAGLENNGTITVGGNTTIHGPIDFSGGGDLLVMSDSETLVVGDLTFSASNVLALTVGPSPGTLDITGDIDLGNATLALDYSAGVFPQAGDTYQILQAGGELTGLFSSTTATAGGGIWDIFVDTLADRVLATFTGLAPTPIGADFNGDGIVNGADLLIWQDNYGRTSPPDLSAFGDADGDGDVDGRDFLIIQSRWGMPGALVADLVSVPEPSSMVLLLSLVGGVAVRRKRS